MEVQLFCISLLHQTKTTTMKIQDTLKKYAAEDIATLEENGEMAITETLFGCLWLSFEDGIYTIVSNGKELLKTNRMVLARSFIMNAYRID